MAIQTAEERISRLSGGNAPLPKSSDWLAGVFADAKARSVAKKKKKAKDDADATSPSPSKPKLVGV